MVVVVRNYTCKLGGVLDGGEQIVLIVVKNEPPLRPSPPTIGGEEEKLANVSAATLPRLECFLSYIPSLGNVFYFNMGQSGVVGSSLAETCWTCRGGHLAVGPGPHSFRCRRFGPVPMRKWRQGRVRVGFAGGVVTCNSRRRGRTVKISSWPGRMGALVDQAFAGLPKRPPERNVFFLDYTTVWPAPDNLAPCFLRRAARARRAGVARIPLAAFQLDYPAASRCWTRWVEQIFRGHPSLCEAAVFFSQPFGRSSFIQQHASHKLGWRRIHLQRGRRMDQDVAGAKSRDFQAVLWNAARKSETDGQIQSAGAVGGIRRRVWSARMTY